MQELPELQSSYILLLAHPSNIMSRKGVHCMLVWDQKPIVKPKKKILHHEVLFCDLYLVQI